MSLITNVEVQYGYAWVRKGWALAPATELSPLTRFRDLGITVFPFEAEQRGWDMALYAEQAKAYRRSWD